MRVRVFKMSKFTDEFKINIINQYKRSNLGVREFAENANISKTSMYKWLNEENIDLNNMKPKNYTTKKRLDIIIQTAGLNDVELAEYCRKKGLFKDEILEWKQDFINQKKTRNEIKKEFSVKSSMQDKKIKKLERQLARKEKALSEAATLLMLQKKMQAYWETEEN